jgi:hypothetical protein
MEKFRSWKPKRVIPGEERLTSRSKVRPKSALLNGRTINNDSAAYARLSSPDSRNTRIPTRKPRARAADDYAPEHMGIKLLRREIIQQVTIQTWISAHFGVLSEHLPVADENLLFIKVTFSPAPAPL